MKILTLTSVMLALFLAPAADAADAVDGNAVYAKKCAKCHGEDGKGDTKMGKKLKIEDLTAKAGKLSDAAMKKAITEGVEVDGKMKMKAVKGLTDEEVAALITFMKSLKP